MLDIRLIPKIEKALGFRLHPIVIQYLTTDIECHWNGRVSGKTTAYMIKLALKKDSEIKLSDLKRGKYNDEYHGKRDKYWFVQEFIYIRNLLAMEGFQVIKIKKS